MTGGVPTCSSTTKSSSPPGGAPSMTFGMARWAARSVCLDELLGRLGVLDRGGEVAWPAASSAGRSSGLAVEICLLTVFCSARASSARRHGGAAGLVGGQQRVDQRLVGAAGPLGGANPVGIGSEQPQVDHGSTLPAGATRKLDA